MTDAREVVLARIRTALSAPQRPLADVPREYRTSGDHPPGHHLLLDLFEQRLLDYRAAVSRCSPGSVGDAVGLALREAGAVRVAVPPGLPPQWQQPWSATSVLDDDLSVAELDGLDGTVTGCAIAIAETGTIVLDSGPTCGRRALTLVPDLHICVVLSDQVVASVPEGVARLNPLRPLTFVSGPSATSDIELSRVEGVHGPRRLHVMIVQPA